MNIIMSENTPANRPAQKGNSTAKLGSPAIATATTRQVAEASGSTTHQKKLYVSFKTDKCTPLITTQQKKGSRQRSSEFVVSESTSAQKRGSDRQTQDTLSSQGAETTTGPWLCLECSVSLPSYGDFRLHLIEKHKITTDRWALCEDCGWRSESNRALHFHKYTDHQINSLLYTFPECDLCDRKYSSIDELQAHLTECLSAHISAIEESEQDPENDGSIIYDIILETDDYEDDDMPLKQPPTARQIQPTTQTQLERGTASDGDDEAASRTEDGNPRSYSPTSTEYNEAREWIEITVSGILKESGDEGKFLLSRVHKKNLTRSLRNKLTKMIVNYFLSRKINMTLQQSYALERDVVRLFPDEKLDHWRSNGKTAGTLYNSFRYKRRVKHAAELQEGQKETLQEDEKLP
ncbi:centrosome-associated zinc finger protein CP190-like isoform X2 [Drosophila guanche]|uniref:Blast:Centrosome-associated zinc finger protein CP190 n=1 Tax=Drosophila guanche TaxID=7266 RepID=A0A3B0JI08_DROGU|nr:centrosome-associated zinc finger protein CP190-like isoform X2 [Drosophila guanche]SPP82044.1 blast:Centrosome-associated zinc finger protein CP190 [Drosophila guanche]